MGLLENDNSIRQCLLEARDIRMLSALRRLFETMLVFCLLTGERELWNVFYSYMVEDYPSTFVTTETCCRGWFFVRSHVPLEV